MSFRLLDERDIKSFDKNYSNALKGTLKGSVVRADDVLPMEYNMNVKSKNIIPLPYYHGNNIVQQGVTITVDDNGVITFNGTALADSAYRLINNANFPVKGTYTISGCDGGSNTTYYLQPFIDGKGVNTLFSGKKTYEWDGTLTSLAFFFKKGTVFENVQLKPQLEEGNTATEYTPYVDPSTVTLTRCGKNILGYAESFSITQDGLTIEYDADEQIFTLNGTPEKASFPINFGSHLFDKFALPLGMDVALSIERISGSLSAEKLTNVFYVGNSDSAGGGRNNWFSVPFPTSGIKTNISTATKKYFTHTWLYIGGDYNVTFTDYKFKIQLEIGNEATNYEEFNGEKYTPTTDGAVDISAVLPTMTLMTDKAGAIIECEYIKDANAVIEKLTNAIISLGGTV